VLKKPRGINGFVQFAAGGAAGARQRWAKKIRACSADFLVFDAKRAGVQLSAGGT
jgi:hypothetical protein